MKTFEELKVGDKLYVYNSFSHQMLICRVEEKKQIKNNALKLCYANDFLDVDCLVILGKDKAVSRINLNKNIIFSTEPIQ